MSGRPAQAVAGVRLGPRRRDGILVVLLATLLSLLVGVERRVGDHEQGVSWEPFVKRRLTLQWRFENPAWRGLEIVPLAAMTAPQRAAFAEFCQVRFGSADPVQCHAIVSARHN
ncbi:hypothetical protein ACFFTM_06675 [Pseudoduganella plicata]|uniref:Uncharacterized protein n=1 Tax=Pseudoduganella plicata TaxID=321984 RepID=A0A4P7BLI7_9BURK|nr:hypothetical protein [Pseudoduganella plicata]QBQ38489.1 hypothetical protein E1742_21625 [Pseudoduganella plicata]GGY82464.1 hypothetical protein GCM10007388_14240 [Pseudoduganella plicata]